MTSETSSLLPRNTGHRSWILVGTISRIRFVPVVAIPPACDALGQHAVVRWNKELHLFSQERHRERLVEQSQLSALALLVIRIAEDPPVKQSSVNIRHHGTDVSRAVGLARCGVFDGLEVFGHRRVEVHRVSLIEGVDLAAGWDGDLWPTSLVKEAEWF